MHSQRDSDTTQSEQRSAQGEPAPAPAPAPPATPSETPSSPPQELPQPDPALDPSQTPTPQARSSYFYVRVRQRRQPIVTKFRITRTPMQR